MKTDIWTHRPKMSMEAVLNEFGRIQITLIPETEEEKLLFADVAANNIRLIKEGSGGPESVVEVLFVVTSPNKIKVEISFPKEKT